MRRRRRRGFQPSPPQLLAGGYLALIILGTALLSIPAATTRPISLSDALFTATSSATVTGLAVIDPGSSFTWFGELVLMVLMQLGGLGLMSFAVFTALLLGRRIGLRQRLAAGDALSSASLGSIPSLVRTLLVFTIIVEAVGAAILATRLVPELGATRGIWESLFHSVSGFNNAGVALRTDNLIGWAHDPVVTIAITTLFITGGLGFTVVEDLRRNRRWRKLSLHTRLMLVGSLVVNALAAAAILVFEHGNPATLGALDWPDRLHAAWMQGTSPRTAGFNVVDMAELRDPTLLVTMMLMFVGAGSASTAGGIKLTTALVLGLAAWAFIRGRTEPHAFGRSIGGETVLRALTVAMTSATILLSAMLALTITDSAPLVDLAFEAVSAFATVGLSLGVTANLGEAGRVVLELLMFLGRIGPLALAYAFASRRPPVIGYPRGEVLTG